MNRTDLVERTLLGQMVFQAALLLAIAGSGQTLKSLDPPVLLPDGTEFKVWEAVPRFSRTHYVDGSNPKAADDNPGTQELPFARINRAAQMLAPGERVIVAAGTYRERICPARGDFPGSGGRTRAAKTTTNLAMAQRAQNEAF